MDTTPLTSYTYNSIEEFCHVPFMRTDNAERCADALIDTHDTLQETRHNTTVSRSMEWYGAPTPEEAAQRVLTGWPEGASKLQEALAQIDVPTPVSLRRKLHRSDQGDELDIHSVNRGDLDHAWTSRKRKHTRSRMTVRIVAQTNLLAEVSAEELFWRGAAAVKLADMLTNAGYSVEIIGALASHTIVGMDGDLLATFPLKTAEQPLDIEALAGVLCNAGFHRIWGFRYYYAVARGRHSSPGAARSDRNGNVMKRNDFAADGTQTFIIPYTTMSRDAAQHWLEDAVKALDAKLTA